MHHSCMLAQQNLPQDYLILHHFLPVGFQRHSAQFLLMLHKECKSVTARLIQRWEFPASSMRSL